VKQNVTVTPSSYQVVLQRGVALVVSLVMLVAITLIGVFVMSNSHLEWLMTNNSRFQSDAFMLAEDTLKSAEATIPNEPAGISWGDPYFDDSAPLYSDPLPSDPNQLSNWSAYTTQPLTILEPGTINHYVIDYVGCTIHMAVPANPADCSDISNTRIYTYRVWARSISSNGASRIIRSTFTVEITSSGAPFRNRIGFTEISS